MYFCIGCNNGFYSVVDSTDNVEEMISLETLKGFLTQGIEILGVTLDSLSIGKTTIIHLDFPSKSFRCGSIFNGYYFEEYNEETYYQDFHNSYLHSVITYDNDDLVQLLPYIQRVNYSIFSKCLSKLDTCQVGYRVSQIFDNGIFNVIDLNTGTEYGFTYSDVAYSILNDSLLVEGFSNITKDEVTISGNNFYITDSISYNTDALVSESNIFVGKTEFKNGKEYINQIYFTSQDLSTFMSKHSDGFITSTRFPVVSLFDYVKSSRLECEDESIEKMISVLSGIKSSVYKGQNGDSFIFDSFSIDKDTAFALKDLVKGINSNLYEDILSLEKLELTKKKFLLGIEQEEEVDAFRINYNYFRGKNVPFKGTYDVIDRSKKYFSYSTNFGDILTSTFIREDYGESELSKIGGITLFSITHTNNFYYRIGRGGITIRLSSKNSKYNAKFVHQSILNPYIDYFRDDIGYYYNRPNIIPLFIHDIVEEDDGVQINIAVILNTNEFKSIIPKGDNEKDKRKGWGKVILVVPLLLTGTRHYFDGDFVVFNMLFQDLVISKSLYNNLVVNIDDDNDLIYIDNCSEISSAKLCNCEVGSTSSVSATEMRMQIKNSVSQFNRLIGSKDYFE